MSLTVDDILGARPGLRTRAKEAAAQAKRREAARHEEEFRDLVADTRAFLVTELGLPEADASDLEAREEPRANAQPVMIFEVDGIYMRATYAVRKQKIDTSHDYEDRNLLVQMTRSSMPHSLSVTWTAFDDLASLGKLLP